MVKNPGENAREMLLDAGTELFRRTGYVATTVDEICTAAGVTKGAFFHHFPSKEALAGECLRRWPERMESLHRSAAYQAIADPADKVLAAVDFLAQVFTNPDVQKSCLAGTTVQEISESNPALRDAANACFVKGEDYFASLLDDACRARGVALDTRSLARHWMGTIQGALLLYKASRDPAVIAESLSHFQRYLASLLGKNLS